MRAEHFAARRLDHRHEQPHDAGQREVFAAALALGRRELADEVFVHPPEQILAAVILQKDVLGKQIDQAGDVFPGEVRSGVDARKQALQFVGIRLFQQLQDVIEPHLDVVGLRDLADVVPAGLFGQDTDIIRFKPRELALLGQLPCASDPRRREEIYLTRFLLNETFARWDREYLNLGGHLLETSLRLSGRADKSITAGTPLDDVRQVWTT